ncbi:MAG: hypothetical protein O2887_15720 [Bacteroidetes bacterium]|nr:hypothetical protein [Bacteroidota bacterium]
MTKNKVSIIIILYLIYLTIPVIFRLDYFPMTWAPMYSAVKASDNYVISTLDLENVRNEGFIAKHQDGSMSNITYKDLNVPFRSFWQIYSQRTYGFGPQVHRFAVNEHGPYNYIERDWETKLFSTINKTLGYDQTNPKYVVELTVSKSFLFFTNTKSNLTLAKTINDTLTIRIGNSQKDIFITRPYLLDVVE